MFIWVEIYIYVVREHVYFFFKELITVDHKARVKYSEISH